MIPLIDYERELEILRELVVRTAERTVDDAGAEPVEYMVGTMIELPRACLLADHIAEHADFFSFGTNDLTQTTLGFSRDDIEAKFLSPYIEEKILDSSPFETHRRARRRRPRADGGQEGPLGQARHRARRLRRAWRRPRRAFTSSVTPAWTTSAARRTACRSRV